MGRSTWASRTRWGMTWVWLDSGEKIGRFGPVRHLLEQRMGPFWISGGHILQQSRVMSPGDAALAKKEEVGLHRPIVMCYPLPARERRSLLCDPHQSQPNTRHPWNGKTRGWETISPTSTRKFCFKDDFILIIWVILEPEMCLVGLNFPVLIATQRRLGLLVRFFHYHFWSHHGQLEWAALFKTTKENNANSILSYISCDRPLCNIHSVEQSVSRTSLK